MRCPETPDTVEAPRILILRSGAFGADVTDRLAEFHNTTVQNVETGTHPALWPYADLAVLATSTERPRIADALDRTAFLRGIPWFPLYIRANDVQVGPVVIPGRTACHACFVRRRRQHARNVTPVPESVADRPVPTGYTRHHVGIATALARQAMDEALQDLDDSTRIGGPLGGTVRMFSLVTGSTARASVAAVDNCPRCRGRFGSPEQIRIEFWGQLERVKPAAPPCELGLIPEAVTS